MKQKQQEIKRKWLKLIGDFPEQKPDLRARVVEEAEEELYTRKKITLNADAAYDDDLIYAWLLVPHKIKGKAPAMLACIRQPSDAAKTWLLAMLKNICQTPRKASENSRRHFSRTVLMPNILPNAVMWCWPPIFM